MATFAHTTVLCRETVASLGPDRQGWVVDCTLGGGGHTKAILAANPGVSVLGLDRDPAALAAAAERLAAYGGRLRAVHATFADVEKALDDMGISQISGAVADLGVSSHQFDSAERGFSLRLDGPLDMRMDPTRGLTLAERLACVSLEDLADILYQYADIQRSIGTARIVLDEFHKGAVTTQRLAERLGARLTRQRSHHPATPVFQALRIWVNEELQQLTDLLRVLPLRLAPGATLAVISFHSGEDRMVKQAFAALAPKRRGGPFERAPDVAASAQECADNPRARSARLRTLKCAELIENDEDPLESALDEDADAALSGSYA